MAGPVDVLIVSLGSTAGLRAADEELLASLRRAGASAELVRADPPSAVRTLMLTDLRWALAARRALKTQLELTPARAIIYSSTTAALLWSRPGAIRFDALSAGNRPGRHGLWQRPLERLRLRKAPLLLPWSDGALRELSMSAQFVWVPGTIVLPVPVEPSAEQDIPYVDDAVEQCTVEPDCGHATRNIAAVAYGANPAKKGLDRILAAWEQARRPGEELVVVGAAGDEHLQGHGHALPSLGVRVLPMLSYGEYRSLLRRARVFVCAARREDYGIAQLEALADGCMLVTTPSPGPYVALELARRLDQRLVSADLVLALRVALDDPMPRYAERALDALAPFRRADVDRLVAEEILPRLLG